MVLSSVAVGYTKALVYHSPFTDPDTIGKTFWIKQGTNEVAQTSNDLVTFYMIVDSLAQNTTYSITGAYWDSMVDTELLNNKISVLISDPTNLTTLLAPKIKSYRAEVEQAVVGVGTSYLILNMEGTGQLVEIQLSSNGTSWNTIYSGELKEEISIPNLDAGTYKIRCRGRVALPDGFTTDISAWAQYPTDIKLDYAFVPPSKPSAMVFTAAKIMDGNERYDVQVKWSWNKGSGANIREFVLSYVSKTEFDKTGWAKASRTNTGATQSTVIANFPWEVATVFKVDAIAWGPDGQNTTSSDNSNFTLNSSTPLDSSFTKETGIEITYSHIKGQKKINNKWEQTFLLNANDGTLNIGLLNEKGIAPISMDPVTGAVNIDGKLISNEIYSASVVLSNLTGTDNPNIRSTGKTYGGAMSGVWMGMGKDNKARFDVGNKDSFIRFDGEKIWMSAGVTIGTPNGDITLGDGITGIRQVTIYQLNTSVPNIPTSQDYPPAGWSKTPPSVTNPFTQKIYASTGQLDPVTDKLVSGTNYSQPVQWSGTTGADGSNGTNGKDGLDGKGTVSIYQLGNIGTVPSASTLSDYPPNGWSVSPPTVPNPLTQCVYVSVGTLDPKTNKLVSGTKWNTPIQFTGQKGPQGDKGNNGTNGTNGSDGKDGFGLTYVYQVSRTPPTIPGGIEYPPTGWSKTPPSSYNATVEAVYASMGTLDPRTNKLVTGTGWSTPIQWSGVPARPVNNNLLTGTTSLVVIDTSNVVVNKSSILAQEDMPTVEFFNLNRGNKFTVSCFIESQGMLEGNHRTGCEMSITYTDGTTQYFGAWHSTSGAFSGVKHSVVTIQNKEVRSVGRMGVYIQGKTVYSKVSQVKLEEGDQPTAWVDAGKDGKQGADGKPGANGGTGPAGANGQRGPGFYRQGRSAAGWSDADATAFFRSTFNSTPVNFDVLTQYHTSNPQAGITRQWNGSTWINPALMVHGDMVLDGTITSKKIVADQAFFAQTGINIIYDRAAALSTNPEATYKMKIDLQNGSIHIR